MVFGYGFIFFNTLHSSSKEPSLCVLTYGTPQVLQYSLNTVEAVSQSNARTPPHVKLPSVKPLLKLAAPLGLCAARAHCVVWNARAAYTWGLNLGQLGHSTPADKHVETPKRVRIDNNKDSNKRMSCVITIM